MQLNITPEFVQQLLEQIAQLTKQIADLTAQPSTICQIFCVAFPMTCRQALWLLR
jgi:cytochrome P450